LFLRGFESSAHFQVVWRMGRKSDDHGLYECLSAEMRCIMSKYPRGIGSKQAFEDFIRQHRMNIDDLSAEQIELIEKYFGDHVRLSFDFNGRVVTSGKASSNKLCIDLHFKNRFFSSANHEDGRSFLHGLDGLEFWLKILKEHIGPQSAGTSLIYIVGTHLDQAQSDPASRKVQMAALLDKYKFDVPVFVHELSLHPIGSQLNSGVDVLHDDIVSRVKDLTNMGETVPSIYLEVEQKISLLQRQKMDDMQSKRALSCQ
jgi:hypothetical protein